MSAAPDFTIVLSGYERQQVDDVISRLRTSAPGTVAVPELRIVLRGYERTQVDAYIRDLLAKPGSATPAGANVGGETEVRLAWPDFDVVLRGYDRKQVDRYVEAANRRIAELERALREATERGFHQDDLIETNQVDLMEA